MLSSSTSDSPSLSRLTPRLSGGYGNGNRSMSQASFGSSQYPGEDPEAFRIRSTYARLESEGVHGDGYLPGVERTRGGPNVGKRATMMEAQKGEAVGEKERGFLSSLDRYGFISESVRNRSESRLALIPTAPLLKIPKLPSTSPLAGQPRVDPPPPGPGGGDGPSPRQPPARGEAESESSKRKETERVEKWMRMMGVQRREGGNAVEWSWKDEGTTKVGIFCKDMRGRRLIPRVYKGIPDRWRMAAWWTLAEARSGEHHGKGKKKAEELCFDYRNSIDLPSSFDVQIDLDVPRTISGHTLFMTRYGAGQRSLFHVLHCFAMLCDTCGYCQGMGPIAATLLCYFDPERVYALMVRLHDVYGMHDIFGPGFPGLLEAFYVQERLMEWLMPDVYKSFQKNMISSSSWGTKWYITLFVNTIPFSQQLRIWDAMFLDGRDVMIMASVAILWSFRDLLAAPTANFESILSLLSSFFVAEDEDKFMRWIKRMIHQPGMKSRMDGWRAEWHTLVREGKDRDALL
ncbi:rab-GTPase-TBC domain-containing protein [Dioszegia hungarica]|uniref:Rab-GTPase-TBC domain-containing protein n=1 Tax=Dioszegia hungarica TaxID=4972 RepID=A0AA38HAK7_9TREE|nr:rab-GTPase-TBC domain-containing protein [Dioszegia hungarica]KAI9637330.1 rab-GTPase-TBC domain-containing protein [Dioszegia hungarica]